MKYISLNNFLITALILTLFSTPNILIHQVIASEIPTHQTLGDTILQQVSQNTGSIHPQTTVADITNTGDNIKASAQNTSDSHTAVQNTNDANVNQSANASANTGDNEASRNISIGGNAGMIDTGDAAVNVVGVVNANNTLNAVGGSGNGTVTDSMITNTGDELSTTTSSNTTNTTAIQNGNKTVINQSANTSANTGGNKADRNISIGGQAGVITTGNASSSTNFLVTANGSVTLIGGDSNGNGPGSGASIVRAANTGDDSHVGSSLSQKKFLIVNNNNNAFVTQSCGLSNQPGLSVGLSGCFANTGDNTSNRGIARGGDAGAIETADAQVNVVMYANANENNTGVQGSGNSVSTLSDIVNTGDDADIDNSASQQSAAAVNNTNNAEVDQHVNASANTGRNTANRNISIGGNAGTIKTGNAGVNVFMIADVNDNTTGISGAGAGSYGQFNGIGVINSGDRSQVTSSNNSANSTSVFNFNFADIFQNALQWVNTGLNMATNNIAG